MADQSHLDILEQGVEAWNRWSAENPSVRPNLREADLSETDLSRAKLSKTKLFGANLTGTNLSGAHLFETDLSGADLSEVDLTLAKLSGANLTGTNLSGGKPLAYGLLQDGLLQGRPLGGEARQGRPPKCVLTGVGPHRVGLLEGKASGG